MPDSNVYDLDALRGELEAKYAPLKINTGDGPPIVFKQLLRLGKKDRAAVLSLINTVEDVEGKDDSNKSAEDVDHVFKSVLDLLSVVSGRDKRVTEMIGEDIGLGMRLFELWLGAGQPGEAQPSPA